MWITIWWWHDVVVRLLTSEFCSETDYSEETQSNSDTSAGNDDNIGRNPGTVVLVDRLTTNKHDEKWIQYRRIGSLYRVLAKQQNYSWGRSVYFMSRRLTIRIRLGYDLRWCLSYSKFGGDENAGVERRHQVAGVENAGRSGVRRRNGIRWTTNASSCASMTRCDNGAYSRIQFLTAVSHSMGVHSEALCLTADSCSSSDEDETSSATTTSADLSYDIILRLYNLVVDFS